MFYSLQDEDVSSDDEEIDGRNGKGNLTEDSDDDNSKKDDGSHARMLQSITGMPREAFEGNVVSGYRLWIMYVIEF